MNLIVNTYKMALRRLIDQDYRWDWYSLSGNPSITFDIVLAHPDKPWDWFCLSKNPSITFDDIRSNPDKPWDWRSLS